MTNGRWHVFEAPVRAMFESGRFSNALSLVIVGTAFTGYAVRQLIGWPGFIGILGALVVLAALSFYAHRAAIEWHGLLPISLLVFVGWCTITVFWSEYRGATLTSAVYQWAWAFLAVYLALVRDTIQVVRVVGDVLRFLLTLSLAFEVLSGLLIDQPIRFLGIQGAIAHLGPIQGVFGSRNALGLVALIAIVTFFIEWRTRSVTRARAAFSLPLGIICALLSRSPVVAVVLVVVVFSMVALNLLRRVRDERRRFTWQLVLAAFVAGVGATAWSLRDPIIALLSAGNMLHVRYDVWIEMWNLSKVHPLTGWGWIGSWRAEVPTYLVMNLFTHGQHSNGLNAYLDVYFQTGLVGFFVFGVLVVLALGRSWLVASNRRSVIHSWSPLIMIAMLATSFTESVTLVEYGWLLLVICTVKASQGMSWRSALPHPAVQPTLE